MQKIHTFHIGGIRCSSCAINIEHELLNMPDITHVKVSLQNHSVEITGDFGDKTQYVIAEELSRVLAKSGYTLTIEKQTKEKNWADFKIAVPVALAFVVLFIFLQKIGLVDFVDTQNVSYGAVFVIGVVASLSTCMAVVGGLMLSMSATFAREGDRIKPQLLFHAGRIVSFFVFGGVIGLLGTTITPTHQTMFVLSFLVGLVMLVLGINLLDIFHFTKRLQPRMPKFLSMHAQKILRPRRESADSKMNHALTPLFVGVATFFLPCGFTQSMQLYALTTGSFLKGGLTMFFFALGTLPVLALIGLVSFSVENNSTSGVFFKTAGLIVIMFALFNLINSLVVIGLIKPVFNF